MRYHLCNIGDPNTDAWWARNLSIGIITAGYKSKPDKAAKFLQDMAAGDWIIAYSKGHGAIGAGVVSEASTYRLVKSEELPTEYESTHRHLRDVEWLYYVERLADAIPYAELGLNFSPRTMKIVIQDHAAAQQIIERLAKGRRIDRDVLPDEIPKSKVMVEGSATQVQTIQYERNAEARWRCIEHWGFDCCVCGTNFAKRYGSLGEGFIHVHHLRPISQMGGENEVDPVNDLRPVCPNCHAMLHRTRSPLSIETLKKIIGDEA